jgi:hypothetical protein
MSLWFPDFLITATKALLRTEKRMFCVVIGDQFDETPARSEYDEHPTYHWAGDLPVETSSIVLCSLITFIDAYLAIMRNVRLNGWKTISLLKENAIEQ